MPEKIKKVSLENLSTFTEELKARYAPKSDLPTKVSDLENDSKFQTEEQVAAAMAATAHLKRKKVASVDAIDPTAEDADQFIYMASKSGSKNGDKYDEYMVLDGEVERVGDWAVDLSGYVKQDDFEEITEAEIAALFDD